MRHPDLVCLSHLRWDHVFQRPHHLMSRAARDRRVFFVEEPLTGDATDTAPEVVRRGDVTVVRPRVPEGLPAPAAQSLLVAQLAAFARREGIRSPWLWAMTPMMVPMAAGISPSAVVYDCMDELSAFRAAPPELVGLERALLGRADIVFTGGRSLYEAKARSHPEVHAFPSSVDVAHFRAARRALGDPADQAAIPRPRIGFYGVIDERIDTDLIRAVAAARPGWQIVLVGPVAKIAEDELPAGPNIHLLGQRAYEELPAYLAGWDVAILPFAINDATRYISPTKTPEYLAGGRPVVSTPIRDVVDPYGAANLVRIAGSHAEFVAAIEAALAEPAGARLASVDRFLAGRSWDTTWREMEALVRRTTSTTRQTAASAPAAIAAAP